MLNKKLSFFLLLFILLNKNLFAESLTESNICYSSIEPNKIDELKIENLSIEFLNNKKWVKNLFNIHKEFEKQKLKSKHKNWFSNFRIEDKYKKKFNAIVLVKFSNNIECKFKARVRVTGDLWWHLDWKKGNPVSSLHIKLLEGNLYNVTQFKLFLKKARFGNNEVFVANLFKELGFISPKTFIVNGEINNFRQEYIFQEDIRKELLENLYYREGPLIEGDERFTISLNDIEKKKFPPINFAKIINKNFLKKNSSNAVAGLEALSNINRLYLYNHNYNIEKKASITSDDLYLFTDKFFNKKNSQILNTYESLAYGLDMEHGLSMDDRRFYYDTFRNFYLPIYYDGKSNILEREQIKKIVDIKNEASNEAILGAERALGKLQNLDLKKFLIKLKGSGLDLSGIQLKEIIRKVISRIDALDAKEKIDDILITKEEFFKRSHDNEKSIKFILTNYEKRQFSICSFRLEDCKIINIKDAEYFNILNEASRQKFNFLKNKINSNDHMVFLFENSKNNQKDFYSLNSWRLSNELNTVKIFSKNMKILINKDKKIISITQLENNGKILFLGGILDRWNINFEGKINDKGNDLKNNFDNLNNLTGCLNFYEVEFNLVNINSVNSLCEDSINIVRSKGNISSIEVNDSSSDALDVDFSKLLINNIKVTSALNDCVDLSSGDYNLGELKLKNCGDKGLSVGEKSTIKLNKIYVDFANYGIASKDSSTVNLKNAIFKNLKICLSAYNKKQEYNGGFIYIDNLECQNYYKKVDIDSNSKIFLNKKQL